MKQLIIFIIFLLGITSCEDVINVDLNTAEQRLVIEASINWQKDTEGNYQEIWLSFTSPFFDNPIPPPPASGAEVYITDSQNNIYTFEEGTLSGFYANFNFTPVLNETYTVTVVYNDEIYTSTETLLPVVSIDFVEQNNDGGFSGNDIEIKAFYTDPIDEENFYLFEFETNYGTFIEVYKDEFTNGNQIFGFFSEEKLKAGDEVIIRIYGISERFYNFMFILLQQISEEGGGPFETQPATVRGNIINQTNPDNFPFGYFRLSEMDEFIYVVE